MATILVVEDEPDVRDVICSMLEFAGHVALRGRVGLESRADVQSLGYDLPLTDIVMRFIDGWELIRLARLRNPSTPIIPISGGSMALRPEAALRLAEAMGVDVTMAKPINRDELLSAIERLTRRA